LEKLGKLRKDEETNGQIGKGHLQGEKGRGQTQAWTNQLDNPRLGMLRLVLLSDSYLPTGVAFQLDRNAGLPAQEVLGTVRCHRDGHEDAS